MSSLDLIALLSGNLKESEGVCQIYVSEPTAKGSEGLEIVIGGLSLSGGVNDFPRRYLPMSCKISALF